MADTVLGSKRVLIFLHPFYFPVKPPIMPGRASSKAGTAGPRICKAKVVIVPKAGKNPFLFL